MGFFELQILEIENYRGQLATGECCGGGVSSSKVSSSGTTTKLNSPSLQCVGAPQCNTLFKVCLREYQSRQQQQQQQQQPAVVFGTAAAISGGRVGASDDETMAMGSNHHQSNSHLHHCSFGNVTSPVLGGNSFTLGGDALVIATDSSSSDNINRGASGGYLALPFSFSWTVSILLFSFAEPTL